MRLLNALTTLLFRAVWRLLQDRGVLGRYLDRATTALSCRGFLVVPEEGGWYRDAYWRWDARRVRIARQMMYQHWNYFVFLIDLGIAPRDTR